MNGQSKCNYLKVADAKPGLVELDKGFTCHCGGPAILYIDSNNELYFYCDAGKHNLNGQVEGDHYIGAYPCNSINQ